MLSPKRSIVPSIVGLSEAPSDKLRIGMSCEYVAASHLPVSMQHECCPTGDGVGFCAEDLYVIVAARMMEMIFMAV